MSGDSQEDHVGQESQPVMLALLRERTIVMGREMRELKEVQRAQIVEVRENQRLMSEKLDILLTAFHQSEGSKKTLLWLVASASSIGGIIGWAAASFRG